MRSITLTQKDSFFIALPLLLLPSISTNSSQNVSDVKSSPCLLDDNHAQIARGVSINSIGNHRSRRITIETGPWTHKRPEFTWKYNFLCFYHIKWPWHQNIAVEQQYLEMFDIIHSAEILITLKFPLVPAESLILSVTSRVSSAEIHDLNTPFRSGCSWRAFLPKITVVSASLSAEGSTRWRGLIFETLFDVALPTHRKPLWKRVKLRVSKPELQH